MKITRELLNKSKGLTSNQKELITRIDVRGETQASVARALGKSPSTISIQHKQALQKLQKSAEGAAHESAALSKVEFEKLVYQEFNRGIPPTLVIARHGHADWVQRLWNQFRELIDEDVCRALNRIAQQGVRLGYGTTHPLSEGIQLICEQNHLFRNERDLIWSTLQESNLTFGLQEDDLSKAVEHTVRRCAKNEEQLSTATRENVAHRSTIQSLQGELRGARVEIEELEPLKMYERLTDDQIEGRRQWVQELDDLIASRQSRVAFLKSEVSDYETRLPTLKSKAREFVVGVLQNLSTSELCQLVYTAMYAKNPRLAMILDPAWSSNVLARAERDRILGLDSGS